MRKRIIFNRIALILIFVTILLTVALFFNGYTRGQARAVSTWSGGLNREWEVNRAANQIYGYNYFYDMWAKIQAEATAIQIAENPSSGYSQMEISGMKMNLVNWIHTYNEDSKKDQDFARYKDRGLPGEIRYDVLGSRLSIY